MYFLLTHYLLTNPVSLGSGSPPATGHRPSGHDQHKVSCPAVAKVKHWFQSFFSVFRETEALDGFRVDLIFCFMDVWSFTELRSLEEKVVGVTERGVRPVAQRVRRHAAGFRLVVV